MLLQNNPYLIPVVFSGVISLLGAFFVSTKRQVIGGNSLFLLFLGTSIWSWMYALELATTQLPQQIFASKLQYIGITTVPYFYFMLASEYAGLTRLTGRRARLLLLIEPIVILLLAWTNELHLLIWNSFEQLQAMGAVLVIYGHGPAFFVHVAFSYLMFLGGSIILIWRALTGRASFRFQPVVMVLGALVTWLGNLSYILGFDFLPGLDLTPVTLSISTIIYAIGFLGFRLIEVMPIEGQAILDHLPNGVMVLDEHGRIVYTNTMFDYFCGMQHAELIGKRAGDALAEWPEMARLCQADITAQPELEIPHRLGGVLSRFYSVRPAVIYDTINGRTIGRSFILNEITEEMEAQERLGLAGTDETHGAASWSAVPLILVYRHSDGRIVEVNRSFTKITGYQRGDVLGQSLLAMGMWEPEQRVDLTRKLLGAKALSNYPLTLRTKAGERLALTAAATLLDLGEVRYISITAQPTGSD